MRIEIHHTLSFLPTDEASNLVVQLLCTPVSTSVQTVERWHIDAPGIDEAARFSDAYGNSVHMLNQLRPSGPIEVVASGIVETRDTHGVLGKPSGEPVPALYMRSTTLTKVPVTLYSKFRASKDSRLSVLHGLMARVSEVLGGPPVGDEPGPAQSQTQQLAGGQSQSQSQSQGDPAAEPAAPEVSQPLIHADAALLAHGFIGSARALGIPARFVSGYLLDDETPGLHAWAEAYDPGLGWIGFDPTHQLCPAGNHVRLSVGLDALSTTPLRAIPAGDGAQTVAVSVTAAS
jgi:transglutaminase-like putative cysteine protease